MTKVKIISQIYPDILEQMVNEFLEKHSRCVSDMQFRLAATDGAACHSVMIIYEED